MGKYSGVNDADATGDRHPYFLVGNHTVEIIKVIDRVSRNRELFIVIEAKLLSTDSENMRVGTTYAQLIKYNNDMGPINLKRFILAANGLEATEETNKEVDEDTVEDVLSDDQPLAGVVLGLQCHTILTKSDKKEFTVHTWSPAAIE